MYYQVAQKSEDANVRILQDDVQMYQDAPKVLCKILDDVQGQNYDMINLGVAVHGEQATTANSCRATANLFRSSLRPIRTSHSYLLRPSGARKMLSILSPQGSGLFAPSDHQMTAVAWGLTPKSQE